MPNPAAEEAQQDVQQINSRQSTGDKSQVLLNEVNSAMTQYANDPESYKAYLQSVRGGLESDPNSEKLLQAVELFDSTNGSNEQKMVQALDRNGDELYKVLDTYATNKGQKDEGSDGDIAGTDMDAFLNDLNKPNSKAAELASANPELKELVTAMKAKGEPVSVDSLLSQLGYADSEGKTDINAFRADHPTPGPGEDYNPDQPQNAVVFSNNGKPETIVQADGTSTGLHYDSNGNIDGMSVSKFDSSRNQVSQQLVRDAQGQWIDKATGEPAGIQAPFIDSYGNFGYYQQKRDGTPSQFTKTTIDTYSGKSTNEYVDLNGTDANGKPIAIAGLNRPLSVDGENKGTFKIGNLEVNATGLAEGQTVADGGLNAQAQGAYTIKEGDNLTNIVRKALSKEQNYDGPDLQAAMMEIAKANGYSNPDQIPAGVALVIPPDWNTRPVVAPPAPAAAAA